MTLSIYIAPLENIGFFQWKILSYLCSKTERRQNSARTEFCFV